MRVAGRSKGVAVVSLTPPFSAPLVLVVKIVVVIQRTSTGSSNYLYIVSILDFIMTFVLQTRG